MSALRIIGGRPLQGTLRAAGNKNAALPLIAAALLTDEQVVLENVPDIGDVRVMLELASAAGAGVDWDPLTGTAAIRATDLGSDRLPRNLFAKLRAGILFAAPLLIRNGAVSMPPPGGDVIGRRRLDAHVEGLRGLGVSIATDREFHFERPSAGLCAGDIFLPEAGVTATSQILMAAVCAKGTTTIRNAACEPHVQDVAHMLVQMGAEIQGIGSNILRVNGGQPLHGTRFRVSSDYTEAGSFLALAAATGGDVTVTHIDSWHYRMISRTFRRLGVELSVGEDTVRVSADQSLRVASELAGGMLTIDDGVWPQFPSDLMSVMVVLATQTCGTVLFFEKLYESRLYFVDRLVAMGANAVICDPHRVVVSGPSRLHGITLNSPDIRAGIALLGAALCADGTSTVRNAESIDRGYARIGERLRSLGAHVERLDP